MRQSRRATSTSSPSTPSAPWPSTRWRRPTPATPARRWAWRRSPTRCGTGSCATIRRSRCGRTATASCSPTGHASMLLYALLHLAGVRAADRQGGKLDQRRPSASTTSRASASSAASAPGHPEYGHTTGVETTTGPLGQGVGNSVGMAIAERWLAARFNRPGHELFDYNVYAICSDGDMMEGVASEAASLAGHLQLSNLCWIYDDNHITIEGHTELAFTEDVAERFQGYGWATPPRRRRQRLRGRRPRRSRAFQATDDRPTLIRGQERHRLRLAAQGRAPRKAHGEPLGEEEVKADQARLRLAGGRAVPGARRRQASASTRRLGARGAQAARGLGRDLDALRRGRSRARRASSSSCGAGELPDGWDADIPSFPADAKGIATREASGKVAERHRADAALADRRLGRPRALDQDHAGVRRRRRASSPDDYGGRNLHFGIREHAMGADRQRHGRLAACAPTPAPSWSSATTCARRCGWRR